MFVVIKYDGYEKKIHWIINATTEIKRNGSTCRQNKLFSEQKRKCLMIDWAAGNQRPANHKVEAYWSACNLSHLHTCLFGFQKCQLHK